ncbi:MAG: hypothetical protein QOG67_1638 [Verrucomicrobiota bacterium]
MSNADRTSMANELRLFSDLQAQIVACLSYTLTIERNPLLRRRSRILASAAEGDAVMVSDRQAWQKLSG